MADPTKGSVAPLRPSRVNSTTTSSSSANVTAPTTAANRAAGGGTTSNGIVGWVQDTYRQATTRFDFDEDETEQVGEAVETLKKLAGEDGRWNAEDLADNVQALQLRSFLKPVAEGQLRKGFEEMTGQPVEKLTAEQKAAARERWEALTPEQRKERAIQRSELDDFRDTMDMVKERAAELGLPESKFPNGMSVEFLEALKANQPGIVLQFKR